MCGRDLRTVTWGGRGWPKTIRRLFAEPYVVDMWQKVPAEWPDGGRRWRRRRREGQWGRPLSFSTKVRGWRGRTLTRRCGFSWSPPPGSWRCRWPGGNKSDMRVKTLFPHSSYTFIISVYSEVSSLQQTCGGWSSLLPKDNYLLLMADNDDKSEYRVVYSHQMVRKCSDVASKDI